VRIKAAVKQSAERNKAAKKSVVDFKYTGNPLKTALEWLRNRLAKFWKRC
jgi:hypothetical protein